MKTKQQYRQEWLERELLKEQRLKGIENNLKITSLSLDLKVERLKNLNKQEDV